MSTQPYNDPTFLKEVWGLFGVGVFVLLLRMVVRTRAVGLRHWQGDDYMAVIVLVCYTIDAITVTLCYEYGTNVDFTPQTLEDMSKKDQNKVIFGSRMQLLAWYTYTGLVWGLKAMMLFFFDRLTFGLKQQTFVKILAIAVGISWAAVFLTITFGCYPTQKNWQVVPYPGEHCTFKSQNFYVSTVLNVLTDSAILMIPLPLMWHLQVPVKKKIALSALLSSGVFVISAAIIRIVMTLVANPSALTINRWGVRETIAGIIAVNIPIIRPVFTKCFWSKNFPPSDARTPSAMTPAYMAKPSSSSNGGLKSTLRSHKRKSQAHAIELTESDKKSSTHTDVAEVNNHHHHNSSSTEDLVTQQQHEDDLEHGSSSSSSSPPKMEVKMEQTYQSTRSAAEPSSSSSSSSGWAHERPWSLGWPRQGYGNTVRIEATGSRGEEER